MSLRKILSLIFLLFTSYARANCYLDTNFSPNQTLTLPPITIKIDAGAADTSAPIYSATTATLGQKISWINCEAGYKLGRNVYNLTGHDPATNTYATNIPGIRIKPLYSNGAGFGIFPREQVGPCGDLDPNQKCRINIPPQSYFKIEFIKTSEKLQLKNKDGDIVLPAGDTLYYWIEFDTPSNHSLKLYMNEVRIVSTPVCRVSDSINIDYNLITSSSLTSAGLEKELNFYANCKTDYGTYSATAYINTDTPSSNSRYIKVKDADGSMDKLAIKIKNSKGEEMLLNNPQSFEMKSSNNSGSTANFNWKAVLFPVTPGIRPANGVFKATAQITLDIN